MSRICLLSGKRANFGQSRSHSNQAVKHQQHVNLQTIRFNGQRIRVAARTLRTLKKMMAQAQGQLPTKQEKKRLKKAEQKV